MYISENLLLYSRPWIRQTKYVVMMAKKGSTKIANFITPRAGLLVIGCGHINYKSYCENALFLLKISYILFLDMDQTN